MLDIDYTLFDHKSVASTGTELMRPYLHEFLTAAYENYNIVIWSATGMKWIKAKMQELGVENNPNYQIVAYLDSLGKIESFAFLFVCKSLQRSWALIGPQKLLNIFYVTIASSVFKVEMIEFCHFSFLFALLSVFAVFALKLQFLAFQSDPNS